MPARHRESAHTTDGQGFFSTLLECRMGQSTNDRTPMAGPSPTSRSRITNGTAILEGADGRSSIVRRYRDVYSSLIEDLGGEDRASEGQRQLARRAGALVVQAESIEAEIVRGEAIDADDYVRLVNALNRTLCNLGLERRPRDVTPDLTTYIASRADQ